MSPEDKKFLRRACSEGKAWVGSYDSLHDAWRECRNISWMEWALDHLGVFYRHVSDPNLLRRQIGNPFLPTAQQRCWRHGTILTSDEQTDSLLVGSMPRCRACLEAVGLQAA